MEKKLETINENEVLNEENIKVELMKKEVEDKKEIGKELLINLRKLIDISIQRGVYKPNEIIMVGKIYSEFIEFINDEEKPKVKLVILNNIKILIEITISRGGYLPLELINVGTIYNSLLEIINV